MKKFSDYIEKHPIFEMALLNKDTKSSGPLPSNKYKVEIYSNDHVPPHFHVLVDDSNLEFYIETGKFYRYKKNSKELNSKEFTNICSLVYDWLFNQKNKLGQTYQEVCVNAWVMWYDIDGFSKDFIDKMSK